MRSGQATKSKTEYNLFFSRIIFLFFVYFFAFIQISCNLSRVPANADQNQNQINSNSTQAPVITGVMTDLVSPTLSVASVGSRGLTTGGTLVDILGDNFTGATQVSFGATSVTIGGNPLCLVVSPKIIVCTSPPVSSPGPVDITVTTQHGTSATTPSDVFIYENLVIITNVVPVTISNFNSQTMLMTVTVCHHGTSNCMTFDNIWMDTGSVGLTIFTDMSSLNLPFVKDPAGRTLADCSNYGFGPSHWGPLVNADVMLGPDGLTASNIVIRQLSAGYANGMIDSAAHSYCGGSADKPRTGPIRFTEAHSFSGQYINGIIGLTGDINDCYSLSHDVRTCGNYSVCSGSGASATCKRIGDAGEQFPVTTGLANPVAGLPFPYNNGFILKTPNIPDTGALSLDNAFMILGIGNKDNNTPPADLTVLNSLYDGTKIGIEGSSICPPGGTCTNNFDTGNPFNNIPIDSRVESGYSLFESTARGGFDNNVIYVSPPSNPPAVVLCNNPSFSQYSQLSVTHFTARLTGINGLATKTLSIPIGNGIPMACNSMGVEFPLTKPYLFNGFTKPQPRCTPSPCITQVFFGMPFFYGKDVYFGMPEQSTVINGVTYTESFVGL